jgi:hypothetical protein
VTPDILPGTARVPFSLSMLGWALNEEDSVGDYIDRAGALLSALTDDYELVFVDDGSTDRTWAIATEYQRTRPWLKAHRNDRNRGSGYNTKRAIALASKDYLFWQTVDWAYDIRQLVRALPGPQRCPDGWLHAGSVRQRVQRPRVPGQLQTDSHLVPAAHS